MEFKDIKIKVPKEMIVYLNVSDEKSEIERNAMILYPYIKNLTISHGKAAEILGISKLELIELYGEKGLAYIDMDMDEIESDLSAIKEARKVSA